MVDRQVGLAEIFWPLNGFLIGLVLILTYAAGIRVWSERGSDTILFSSFVFYWVCDTFWGQHKNTNFYSNINRVCP